MNNDIPPNLHTQSNLPTTGPTGLAAGSVLGTYTLIEPLGRGGMGQVWKASDGKRAVAIKLLRTEFRGNAAAMAQVEDAFQIVHALTHEHICKTLGLFDDPVHGPYLVLDFVPGITLSEYQRTGGFPKKQLPVELVAEILRPVARALDYSHRKVIQLPSGDEHIGVLHRDVKPDNILIVQREGRIHEVWLIDFGLAAEIRNTMTKHTISSVDTRGTRPYMSPEQIKGKRHQWDARTDQYSLAVVAYQLLSGHLPFDGDDEFSLMLAITQEPADPIPGLPEQVNAAVLKGLAKNKDERFRMCQEFVDALVMRTTPTVIIPKLDTASPGVTRVEPRRDLMLPIQSVASHISNSKLGDVLKVTLPGGGRHNLIWCPSGNFLMGSPATESNRWDDENQVKVALTSGFWLGQTVVTQEMWSAVMRTTPWIEHGDESRYKSGTDYPVVYINHFDATAFCNELTTFERTAGRLPTGWKFALPTEAQWEYACRAGTKTAYSCGDGDGSLGQYAWFDKNAWDIGEKYAHAVGTKEPNPWGLYDMHGNVWEWCRDGYVGKLPGGIDPLNSDAVKGRCVLRGGSWFYGQRYSRSASRRMSMPDVSDFNTGFRLSMTQFQ